MVVIESLLIGEIEDYSLINIQQSVTNFTFDLTSSMVSEVKLTVHDPGFQMYNNNFFMIGRRVTFNFEEYEIAAVSLRHNSQDSVEIQARSRATERMRRDKGAKSFGNISPSVFAANMAQNFGLKIFAQDSPATNIKRESSDNSDESTWDVLQRLARDLEFMCFEARGTLFFASQKFIADNQDPFVMSIPSLDTSPFYLMTCNLSTSQDTKKPSSFTATLIKNSSSTSIYPGTIAKFTGISQFEDRRFMVERVNFNGDVSSPVQISGSSVETVEEIECVLNTFAIGSSGNCVKRIQTAVKTIVDGDFGPVTKRAVESFQRSNGLPVTGVVDRATWAKIESV